MFLEHKQIHLDTSTMVKGKVLLSDHSSGEECFAVGARNHIDRRGTDSGAGYGRVHFTQNNTDVKAHYSDYGSSGDESDHTNSTNMSISILGSTPGSSHGDLSPQADLNRDVMPADVVVLRAFEEYLEALSPLSDEEENKHRLKTLEEKWQLIFNVEKEPSHGASTYIENLRKYVATAPRHTPSLRRAGTDGPTPLSYWLRKLKADLRAFPTRFLNDFVDEPNHGLRVLADILSQIHKDQDKLQSIRKSRADQLKQAQLDEYDCLLCFKFALKATENVSVLLNSAASPVDMIAMCLLSSFRKTTVVVIEVLTAMCDSASGYTHVLDAMTVVRLKSMESVRFKMIASMLHSQNINRHFQAVCVRFFNKLVKSTNDANAKVFLQYEISLAGFEPDTLDKHSLTQTSDSDELQQELDIWRKNFISVDGRHQELFELQNRNQYLRDEIDRQNKEIQELGDSVSKLSKERVEAAKRREEHREKMAELQDTLSRVVSLYKDRVGEDPSDEIGGLENQYTPMDNYATVKGKYNSVSSAGSGLLGSIATIPDAPPLIPADFLSKTVRRKVETHNNLPMLNWSPLPSIKNTLFEDMDDEAKIREIDFSDLDKLFQLPAKEVEARELGERIILATSNKITFVELSRARNLIITMKRTNLNAEELKDAIDMFNVEKLPGESAELLLKFIPNSFELKQLAEHQSHYRSLGEAEKYLFQMTKVERLERKLTLLAFVGKFDDVIHSVRPKIELIHRCSESLIKSLKLKKILEIILAFGNYMNGNKKGFALGFRLESLTKLSAVKARSRSQQTLLHFLVEYVERHYPELRDFGDELDLCVEKGVSFQSVGSDILNLRKGMDLLRSEREKQHSNDVLNNFHKKTSVEVLEIFDSFRRMEEAYQKMCAYFGEKHREIEPEEIVKYLADFMAAFKKASRENHERLHPSQGSHLTRKKFSASTGDLSSQTQQTSSQTSFSSSTTPRTIKTNKSAAQIQDRTKPSTSVTSNLNTPSKQKADKHKVIVGEKQLHQEALYDETVPAQASGRRLYDSTLPESNNIIYHDIPLTRDHHSDARSSDSLSRTHSHVTSIKVSPSNKTHGSTSTAGLSSSKELTSKKSVVTEDGNIRLKDSHSFYFGAKPVENRVYATVKKTPSLSDSAPLAGGASLKRTSTTPLTTHPIMVINRVHNIHQNGYPNTVHHDQNDTKTYRIPHSDPIYEEIPQSTNAFDTSRIANGYSNGQTNSTSSAESSREHTASITGYKAQKHNPWTSAPSKTDRGLSVSDSPFLTKEFGDAIDTLDQVLDDAMTEGTVASIDENTSL